MLRATLLAILLLPLGCAERPLDSTNLREDNRFKHDGGAMDGGGDPLDAGSGTGDGGCTCSCGCGGPGDLGLPNDLGDHGCGHGDFGVPDGGPVFDFGYGSTDLAPGGPSDLGSGPNDLAPGGGRHDLAW